MVNIPNSLFQLYNEVCDDFINLNFGVNCTLVYPPKQSECPNCIVDLIGGKSSNLYKTGGPYPFQNGMICPYCNGDGFLNDEPTEVVKLRVYWNRKDWLKVGISTVPIPDGSVQVIGFLSDLPKILQCNYIKLVSDNEAFMQSNFVRIGEPFYHGFKKDRYFVLFLGKQ